MHVKATLGRGGVFQEREPKSAAAERPTELGAALRPQDFRHDFRGFRPKLKSPGDQFGLE
jgi:hypothetical protein